MNKHTHIGNNSHILNIPVHTGTGRKPLPPMTPVQKRLYIKLRNSGIPKEESLRQAMTI